MAVRKLEKRENETEQIYAEEKILKTDDLFTKTSLDKAKAVLTANLAKINARLEAIKELNK